MNRFVFDVVGVDELEDKAFGDEAPNFFPSGLVDLVHTYKRQWDEVCGDLVGEESKIVMMMREPFNYTRNEMYELTFLMQECRVN